jgi:UDP-N-acetylglucosamine 1-carboxyvinyltransferase
VVVEKFLIEGGVPLRGTVRVSGSKNSTLPIMAAALMADEPVTLKDVPRLRDVATLANIMGELGVRVERITDLLRIETLNPTLIDASYDLVRKMRGSICVLGPLLARRGEAKVALPGGCVIGTRPVDLHIKGLRALGAEIDVRHGDIIATAKRLKGAEMYLGGAFGSTVLGTANVMSAAVLAEGHTVIEGAACEPEVEDLGNFLNAMGAHVKGHGSPRIEIDGVERLHGCEYQIISDRIEAATLMIAAAATKGNVKIENVRMDHLRAVTDKLLEIGVKISSNGNGSIHVTTNGHVAATDIVTLPYPGIPTDVQAQFMTLLAVADGISVVTEKVFPDRFMHVSELDRMGAHIRKEGPNAIVMGVKELSGAPVMASDLRASAALVVAGMAARGLTEVNRVYHIDRGYEGIEVKLNALGASIQRVDV